MTAGTKDEPVNDPADRQVFALHPDAWDELQEILNRPVTAKPKIAALLANHRFSTPSELLSWARTADSPSQHQQL